MTTWNDSWKEQTNQWRYFYERLKSAQTDEGFVVVLSSRKDFKFKLNIAKAKHPVQSLKESSVQTFPAI